MYLIIVQNRPIKKLKVKTYTLKNKSDACKVNILFALLLHNSILKN